MPVSPFVKLLVAAALGRREQDSPGERTELSGCLSPFGEGRMMRWGGPEQPPPCPSPAEETPAPASPPLLSPTSETCRLPPPLVL